MNKQYKGPGQRGIEWTDFTWNPVGGCFHACRWTMPDGSIARCYAEAVALKFGSAYPLGFENHYWRPDKLDEPQKVKKPARIFLDSMSDLMGHWVPDEQIEQVLDACRKAPQHTFQLLTKNAPRLERFEFPDNVWVGVSAPPSEFMGRPLTFKQQYAYVERAVKALHNARCKVRWMSIEPLSFDIWHTLQDARLDWAVIGAATNGPKVYQPDPAWVTNLLRMFDRAGTAVFFKGNLKGNPAATIWREEFPQSSTVNK